MTQIINLKKDQQINLAKDGVGLTKGVFGLGWKPATFGNVDIDASCLAIGADGKGKEWIYYRHLSSNNGSIKLDGDDLTGADNGEGTNAPDENITIELDHVDAEYIQLILIINVFSNHKLGAVKDAFCRVTDYYSNEVLAEYDLDAEFKNDKAVVVGSLKRVNDSNEWSFTAVGKGFSVGVEEILKLYGMM